ncbi:selenocysteine-specific translation elongation factor [Alteribacillus iranensis]|uniref:Selenocysteine-specific elongation factor n=1 Tax=Alteribacillus iranensis TaxID=930128 RepID=A0A1I2A055_9BACI|nr:selenocysteine-specific translation elongation factor [Alteribacillus iranensis]SFE37137.1 selenocysteine-specific elongation factor [Alteribacillus iranensis]
MEKRTFTIGMAGHIDHGKTTLTKALTNIDTDRLQEEKARSISIEPGFAPLSLTEELEVSIIDVPGHERFIRQMIAGVAGIDAVVLTVAADEGVMPQTKEHLEILSLLEVRGGLIAVTKSDTVDSDLLKLAGEDIREEVKGTPFEKAEMVFVDSLTGKGLEELKEKLITVLSSIPVRNSQGAFRLPIDQVFSVHGQGTVVRGTVYEGSVQEGEHLQLLPMNQSIRVKQLQVHGTRVTKGNAGQRLALNITGVPKEDISRGDVIVATEDYITTNVLNIFLIVSESMRFKVKQRGEIKLHLGTAEVYGTIVFFDRNIMESGDGRVLCQLRLDEPVVTKRNDRFILRRPSPVETIGGGWVINPQSEHLRFGKETIQHLEEELEGSPKDHVMKSLNEHKWLTREELAKFAGISLEEIYTLAERLIKEGEIKEFTNGKLYTTRESNLFLKSIRSELQTYHEKYPLRLGKNKEELYSKKSYPKELGDRLLEVFVNEDNISREQQYLSHPAFTPHYPKGWEKRMEKTIINWEKDGVQVSPWQDYTEEQSLPASLSIDLRQYLLQIGKAAAMDDKHIWPVEAIKKAAHILYEECPETFSLQDAKNVLGLTRKYLVPLLEWMDDAKWTKRSENIRIWRRQL